MDSLSFFKLSLCNYEFLASILDREYAPNRYCAREAYNWLGCLSSTELCLPLDQMPLYINSSDERLKVMALWRLKIGR